MEILMSRSTRMRNIDWDQQPLGELPDTEIARRLDVTPSAVHAARKKRDIPTYQGDKRRRRSDQRDIDWSTVDLGHRSDSEIARELDVSQSTVTAARQRRGLSPFEQQPSDAERVRTVNISVYASDLERIDANAKAAGLPRSTYMCRCALLGLVRAVREKSS